jgi:hypothetical protein
MRVVSGGVVIPVAFRRLGGWAAGEKNVLRAIFERSLSIPIHPRCNDAVDAVLPYYLLFAIMQYTNISEMMMKEL